MEDIATLRAWHQQWITYLRQRKRSPTTLITNETVVRAYVDWLEQHHDAQAAPLLSMQALDDYVIYLRDERVAIQDVRRARRADLAYTPALAHSTIRGYISILTRWLQWLIDRGKLAAIADYDGIPIQPPAIRDLLERLLDRREPLVAPRMPNLQRLPGYYELELQRFVAQQGKPPSQTGPSSRAYLNLLRNRALVGVLFASGGRIAEVLSIPVADVGDNLGIRFRVPIRGKGRKRRTLRLDNLARTWVGEYLDARTSAYSTATALFISHGPKANGKQLSAVSAWRIVKEAALWLADLRTAEGADREEIVSVRALSPHSLRHFLAQSLLDEGAEYKDIAALLGHSSTVVTEQVYARQDEITTHEIADTFAPRAILPQDSKRQKG